MQTSEIIEKAERFCAKHDVIERPVKIVNLCAAEGISVFEQYLPENVSGFIVIQDDIFQHYETGRLIVVNLSDSASRRRFTIAHELAHYILHWDESHDYYAHRDAGQNTGIEQEANIFASCVLMPQPLVESSLDGLSEIFVEAPPFMWIDHIAKEFAVSRNAAQVRLEQLGLMRRKA